jgi:hypothetical protein
MPEGTVFSRADQRPQGDPAMTFVHPFAAVSIIVAAALATIPAHAAGFSSQSFGQESSIIVVGGNVMLNPQPLPPRDYLPAGSINTTLGEDVSLNPQPLPPRYRLQVQQP